MAKQEYIFPKDIIERLERDFGDDSASDALNMLEACDDMPPRVIRCIIFLSGAYMEKLKHNTECALKDFRDVIYWAEYVDAEDKSKPVRVRNFNKTFEDAEL